MLKLMELEMRKYGLKGLIKGAAIANLCIFAFLLLIVLAEKSEGIVAFPDYVDAFMVIGVFSKLVFTVFSSVLIARFIIGEFNNKTISVLFMYPINRKKLLMAKLVIIVVFTFLSIFLTDLLLGGLLVLLNFFYPLIPNQLTGIQGMFFLISAALDALAFSGVSLIPLYFGMKAKSVSATIVSSVLIVSLLSANNNGFSLSSITAVPLSLAVLGVIVAFLSIKNIEHQDIV